MKGKKDVYQSSLKQQKMYKKGMTSIMLFDGKMTRKVISFLTTMSENKTRFFRHLPFSFFFLHDMHSTIISSSYTCTKHKNLCNFYALTVLKYVLYVQILPLVKWGNFLAFFSKNVSFFFTYCSYHGHRIQ